MKILLIYAITFLIPVGAIAQSPPPPRTAPAPKLAPTPTRVPARATTRRVPQRPAPVQPAIATPARNITLTWQGSLAGSFDIDLEMTGCGPQFTANLTVPDPSGPDVPPTILTVSSVVTKAGDTYRVNYSVGARIAIKTPTRGKVPNTVGYNFEFRDVMMSGDVILSLGKPVTISKSQGKSLVLSLSEPE